MSLRRFLVAAAVVDPHFEGSFRPDHSAGIGGLVAVLPRLQVPLQPLVLAVTRPETVVGKSGLLVLGCVSCPVQCYRRGSAVDSQLKR